MMMHGCVAISSYPRTQVIKNQTSQNVDITLLRSIVMLCGTECGEYDGIFYGILSTPQMIVMDLNNVKHDFYKLERYPIMIILRGSIVVWHVGLGSFPSQN